MEYFKLFQKYLKIKTIFATNILNTLNTQFYLYRKVCSL